MLGIELVGASYSSTILLLFKYCNAHLCLTSTAANYNPPELVNCPQMARLNSNEGEQPFNLLRPGFSATQDASNFSATENLCDKLYKSLNQNITNCEYFEVNSQIVDGSYDHALILMHVNIPSL